MLDKHQTNQVVFSAVYKLFVKTSIIIILAGKKKKAIQCRRRLENIGNNSHLRIKHLVRFSTNTYIYFQSPLTILLFFELNP